MPPYFALADVLVRVLYSSVFGPTAAPCDGFFRHLHDEHREGTGGRATCKRETSLRTLGNGIAALINVGANLLLVPPMGISGAAIASSISYSILSGILIYYS